MWRLSWAARAFGPARRFFGKEQTGELDIDGVRGMPDSFSHECRKMRFLEDAMRRVCAVHGFAEVRTPIVEKLAVFHRALGETSDVVSKEYVKTPIGFPPLDLVILASVSLPVMQDVHVSRQVSAHY
jgi:hypothetical protein